MKVLVTGKRGQLAQCLALAAAQSGVAAEFIGRPEHDLAQPASLREAIVSRRPDVVIAAAAYTAVDKAESEPELAMRINAEAPRELARICQSSGIPVVSISTDYVFDGAASRPYDETAAVNPINAYGRSKLAGEQAVAEETDNYAVLRTAWVFSPFGSNFVLTMLRLAQANSRVRVISDTIGNPTSAMDLAKVTLQVAERLVASGSTDLRGVFHAVNSGDASWADLAEAVFAQRVAQGLSAVSVERISSAEYPTPARRPANSRLDCSKLAAFHGIVLPNWRTSLQEVLGLHAAHQTQP